MSSLVSIEWTCERCGATTTTPHGKQPERWHRVYAANPPLSAEHESNGDVCDDCWIAFCTWWQAPRTARPSDLDRERDEAEQNGSMDRGEGMP